MAPLPRRAVSVATLLALAVTAAACSSSPSVKAESTTTTTTTATTTTPTSTPANVPDDTTAGPLGPLQGGALPVPAPTGATVTPPSTITANCSTDVSGPLKKWFNKLPVNSTVLLGSQDCYQVDNGIKLKNPQGLTIYGGTFTSDATTPVKKHSKGNAVFTLVGGSKVTLESMKINGRNPGGYHYQMAFAAGIDVQGTDGITIRGVTITNAFGDGITLSPLRGGSDHNSGTIVAPTKTAVINGVSIIGAGRQAVTLASVSGAQIGDLVIENPGLNTFDIEADQGNEGAENVAIDGCTSSGGGLFFANGGSGAGQRTGNFTVAHCAMAKPTAGDAILSYNRSGSNKNQRGPFNFVADVLYCGASTAVACVQLSGAKATVENSVLHFPEGTVHEAVYHVVKKSGAVFTNDNVSGYGKTGHVSGNSSLKVTGGRWVATSGQA